MPIEGRDLAGVYEIHALGDALAVCALFEAYPPPARGVVVGGGYVGLEMAEALHTRGLHTTIVASRGGLLGDALDPEMGAHLADRVRALGIDVDAGHRVECITGHEGHVTAVGCGERSMPADLVIMATGMVPRVALARAAGLRIGTSGAVWVDDHQRTSAPGVYAAGDCAEVTHRVTGAPLNLHWARSPTSRGASPGSTSAAATRRSPACLPRRSRASPARRSRAPA